MPCHAIPCHAMPCHAMPCHAMPCHAMPCHAMPCHAMPCHAMPCHAMLYTSDFWGCLKVPKDTPVQILFMSICKQIPGVQKQTTNSVWCVIRTRIDSPPLVRYEGLSENWERLRGQKAYDLLLASYRDGEKVRLPWRRFNYYSSFTVLYEIFFLEHSVYTRIGQNSNLKSCQTTSCQMIKTTTTTMS